MFVAFLAAFILPKAKSDLRWYAYNWTRSHTAHILDTKIGYRMHPLFCTIIEFITDTLAHYTVIETIAVSS